MDDQFSILVLHQHPEYLTRCCALLNEEWPRSQTARLRSLEASNDNLPTSLVLIENAGGTLEGHARVAKLPRNPEGCWVESVVISKKRRGRGLGRLLMKGCEKFAARRGFRTVYLSTHDKMEFYGKLGFEKCEPVSYFGSGSFPVTPKVPKVERAREPEPRVAGTREMANPRDRLPPPPPPPPPKAPQNLPVPKTFMKKEIQCIW